MTFLLTIYCLALIGLIVLFAHKRLEGRRGAPLFSPVHLAKLDRAVEDRIIRRLEKALRVGRLILSLARLEAVYKLYTLAIRTVRALHDKSAAVLERLQGKQVSFVEKVRATGGLGVSNTEVLGAHPATANDAQVSFFLKNISGEGKGKSM